jgi:hypothetical protein
LPAAELLTYPRVALGCLLLGPSDARLPIDADVQSILRMAQGDIDFLLLDRPRRGLGLRVEALARAGIALRDGLAAALRLASCPRGLHPLAATKPDLRAHLA